MYITWTHRPTSAWPSQGVSRAGVRMAFMFQTQVAPPEILNEVGQGESYIPTQQSEFYSISTC